MAADLSHPSPVKASPLVRAFRTVRRAVYQWKTNAGLALTSTRGEARRIYGQRLRQVKHMDLPLALISQVQRSGGTLVSQLLDGHSMCHTHPHELTIGYPRKYYWPELDLEASPKAWFAMLFEQDTRIFHKEGYEKYSKGSDGAREYFPFLLPPKLQREIFLRCATQKTITRQREILDCYMTSYFNAWLDYRAGFADQKFVVAFTPRVSMYPDSLARYFADYPDGKLISIVRDPKSWYVSSHRHSPRKYSTVKKGMAFWKQSASSMLVNREQYGERFFPIIFEQLVTDTQSVMERLATFLDIPFEDILLTPTFQGMPIKTNSAFAAKGYGVNDAPVNRAHMLTDEEQSEIDVEAGDLYQEVVEMAGGGRELREHRTSNIEHPTSK